MGKLNSVKEKVLGFLKFIFGKVKGFLGIALGWMKKHKIWTAIICVVLVIAIVLLVTHIRTNNAMDNISLVYTAERRDIEETIGDSTMVEPNNEYSISTNVQGDILSDTFEEGDEVSEGETLYVIDSSDIESNIESALININSAKRQYEEAVLKQQTSYRDTTSAANSVTSAEISLQKSRDSLSDAVEAVDDLYVTSKYSGAVSKLYVEVGDDVTTGTVIADIVDNSTLEIKVPFNTADAANIYVGESAVLTLTSNGTQLYGTVTEVSSYTQSGSGYSSYRNVTIQASNPGAVSAGDTATAMVGNMACNDAGTFENATEKSITATTSGEIQYLYISDGSTVYSGQTVAVIDNDDLSDGVTNAQYSLTEAELSYQNALAQKDSSDISLAENERSLSSSVESAWDSYQNALISYENLLDQLEDYTITAPISGTVVTKNYKAGETIGESSSSSSSYSSVTTDSSALAIIYDLSSLKCTLSVDEVDIKYVEEGQACTITTDVNDTEYTGVVETISVNGVAGSNGVTTYPVTIRIIDFDDDLLPGMNIDVSIVIESSYDTLSVPVGAVNRGNIVYVEGEKTDENDTAPDGYYSVEVTTGVSNDDYIEILSGLNEGDVVYVQSTSSEVSIQTMMMNNMQNNMQGAMGGGNMGGGMQGGGGGMPGGGGGGMR